MSYSSQRLPDLVKPEFYHDDMPIPHIVIDTNVMVAGLRSRRGSAFRLLGLVGAGRFDIHLSVPLVLEYEEVAKRQLDETGLSPRAVDDIIDYLCSIGIRHQIHFLWRPLLPDLKDDMVLEAAVA